MVVKKKNITEKVVSTVKTKTPKMTTKTISMNDVGSVRELLLKFTDVNCVWDETLDMKTKKPKNIQFLNVEDWLVLEFRNKKEQIIISYDEIKIPKKYLKHITNMYRKTEECMTEEEFKAIPFYSSLENLPNAVTDNIHGLLKRKTLALEIAARFEKLGIKRIETDFENCTQKIRDIPTLCFDEDGNSDWNGIDSDIPNSPHFRNLNYDISPTTCHPLIFEIRGESRNIGYYIPKRNIIILGFALFSDKDGLLLTKEYDLVDNKTLVLLFERIESMLSSYKIKKMNTTGEREALTLENFLSSLKNKKINMNDAINDLKLNIKDHESMITRFYRDLTSQNEQIKSINIGLKNMGNYLKKEIASLRKLSVVNKVKIIDGCIQIEYIPTYIKVPKFELCDSGDSFGTRYIYIGRMIANLYPDKIKWSNKDKFEIDSYTYNHPHVNSSGKACHGSGKASNLISKLIGNGKYTELIRYLWMWIQTCKDGSGYSRAEIYYNYNLRRGFPVWDEKNERILINDESRISSGEQMKLEPLDCMEDNLKIFEKYKKPR